MSFIWMQKIFNRLCISLMINAQIPHEDYCTSTLNSLDGLEGEHLGEVVDKSFIGITSWFKTRNQSNHMYKVHRYVQTYRHEVGSHIFIYTNRTLHTLEWKFHEKIINRH